MSNPALRQGIASHLARLHNMDLTGEVEPLIWHSCDAMIHLMKPESMLPGFDFTELVEEVRRYRSIVHSTLPKLVTCHGDMKPANIIRLGSQENSTVFIDFELSGLGYRGYDIFKLFRTDEVDGDKLRQFVIDYVQKSTPEGVADECEVQRVHAEALMFEPLTYLEPVIFFNSVCAEYPDTAERFSDLAHARWEKYLQTKHFIEERADALRRLNIVCRFEK